jgi:hypothetical protein
MEVNKKKVDEITSFIIEYMIKDFFEDNIYKYYFLSEKPIGIKTNYNYVKKYYEDLKKLIS